MPPERILDGATARLVHTRGLITPSARKDYPTVDRGDGIYLFDTNGKRYIDASSGVLVANLGHNVQEIVDAMTAQATRISFVFRGAFTSLPAFELSEEIAKYWAPAGLGNTWFSSGGSEAVEAAFRFARQYQVEIGKPTKYKIVSTWHSYHGSTLAALSAGGFPKARSIYENWMTDAWPHIASPYCYRCPLGLDYPTCGVRCADELERAIKHHGPENIAAFIIEPVVGSTTGGTNAPPEYFGMVRQICDRYGVLLIADEVMSGFGRTGTEFAINQWNVVPDIIVSGKGLGAGYVPLFATLVHDRVIGAIREGSGSVPLGNTYCASPLSCGVGLAVLQYARKHDLVRNSAILGQRMRAKLDELSAIRIVGDVRGRGLMQGVELVANQQSRTPLDPALRTAERVARAAQDRGLLLISRTGMIDGTVGDHVFLGPPLTSRPDQVDEIVSLLEDSISSVARSF